MATAGTLLSSTAVHVIDDHRLYRGALVRALDAAPGLQVGVAVGSVGEFAGLAKSFSLRRNGAVVVLGLRQPPRVVAGAVAAISDMGFRVVMISVACRQSELLEAWAAGCRGCVDRLADLDELHRAIRQVAAGLRYLSPVPEGDFGPQPPVELLSNREREVLALLASGERDREIAVRLSVSVHTVRTHLEHIRRKTGQRRRAELTRFAVESGIVHER
ncbi:MAG TPA: response regulator transcription factor [Candidatus Limnocylindrales bacterium]